MPCSQQTTEKGFFFFYPEKITLSLLKVTIHDLFWIKLTMVENAFTLKQNHNTFLPGLRTPEKNNNPVEKYFWQLSIVGFFLL